MTGLAISVLVICALIVIGVFAWLGFEDMEALIKILVTLVLVIIFSTALTWSLTELGIFK